MATFATTEGFDPAYATQRAAEFGIEARIRNMGSPNPLTPVNWPSLPGGPNAIELIARTMEAAGWTIEEELYASGIVLMPNFHDDNHQEPIHVENIIYFDGDNWDTLTDLAISIDSTSRYHCVVETGIPFYSRGLRLTAKLGGPYFNQPSIWVMNYIAAFYGGAPTPGAASGGGYRLRSALNPASGYQYDVSIYEDTNGQIIFEFALPGATGIARPQYQLAAWIESTPWFSMQYRPVYTCIATPHQFMVIDQANPQDFGGFGTLIGGNSIFATSPEYDENWQVGDTWRVVVVGPGRLKENLVYNESACSVALNQDFKTFFPGQGVTRVGMAARMFPFDQPLLTSNEKGMAQTAYLVAPEGPGVESSVLGKVWDGIIVSQSYGAQMGTDVMIDGKIFHNVSNQDSAVESSLWLRTQ